MIDYRVREETIDVIGFRIEPILFVINRMMKDFYDSLFFCFCLKSEKDQLFVSVTNGLRLRKCR